MGDKALGVIEIVPAVKFYDYEAKYAPGGSKHLLPAPVASAVYSEVQLSGACCPSDAWLSRCDPADFRYDHCRGDGEVCFEVNTQPGMTETSLVPEMADTPASPSMSLFDGWSRTLRSTAKMPFKQLKALKSFKFY